MAKINLSAINTRLIISFSLMAVLMIALVIIMLSQIAGIINTGNQVLLYNQPSRLYAVELNSSIRESNLALVNYIGNQNDKFSKDRKQIWERGVYPSLDSLQKLSEHWKKAEAFILLDKIERTVLNIKVRQEELISKVRSGSSGGSVSIDVYDYPMLDSDTLLLEDGEFQIWIDEQLRGLSVTDANEEVKKEFYAEIMPLNQRLNQQVNDFYDLLREEALEGADVIYSRVARFTIITVITIIVSLLLSYLLFRYVRNKVMRSINLVQKEVKILGAGNLPEARINTNDELDIVLEEISKLSANLGNLKGFALAVGKGEFDNDISVFNNEGEIGTSLAEMRDSLKKVADEDRKRNWANQGYAEFGDILRKNSDDLDKMADELITQMVRYLNANQGGLFILEEEGDNTFLDLKASYAYDRRKFLEKRLEIGQGLIGQSVSEKEEIYLREVPEDYVQVTSGLGKATPTFLFIVPLIFNDEVFGAMEIASFEDFDLHQREFILKQSESIASTISNVKINQNTKKLLEESQQMTEQMRSQEEEMRQNMEELQATQEEVHRNQQEMTAKTQQLSGIISHAAAAIITTNDKGLIQFANPKAAALLGYSESQLKEKHVTAYIPDAASLNNQLKESQLTGGKKNQTKALVAMDKNIVDGEAIIVYSIVPLPDNISATSDKAQLEALVKKEEALLAQIAEMQEQLSAKPDTSDISTYTNTLNNTLKEKLKENEEKLKAAIAEQKKALGL